MTAAQSGARYDCIGRTYRSTRRPEPRIAAAIRAALGEARSVANVGAGTGSYEPADCDVLAIEPSATMVAQRPPGSAPAVRARAEALPLADRSIDAALAVNTVHHWGDERAGLRELRRVARQRVVILHRDSPSGSGFWLTDDYVPALDPTERHRAVTAAIIAELNPTAIVPVPLPSTCADGVFSAYWARPERYLDPEVRRNISNFALVPEEQVAAGLARLADDLRSGAWDRKLGHLRSLDALDLGHRLFIAEHR
jgi:SAM-dependent methyltransferase